MGTLPKLLSLPKATRVQGTFNLPLSKSLTNRALVLNALYPDITLSGISSSADSQFLVQSLQKDSDEQIYVGAGGTTLRFSLAYWATQPGKRKIIGGTDVLNSRIVAPLVEALNALGGSITYIGELGCAPLQVEGKSMKGGHLALGHLESSQFVSALMLIGPFLEEGLDLHWESVVSAPYLMMTAAMMRQAGFEVELKTNGVFIPARKTVAPVVLKIEPDWSALAFWCEAIALSPESQLFFPGFTEKSTQGDCKVIHYFEPLGVGHSFTNGGIRLFHKRALSPGLLTYNLVGEPDLAQALILTMIAKRIPFEVNGLGTLRGKECDRINALEIQALTLGIELESTQNSLRCLSYPQEFTLPKVPYSSMEDHRVAMSLAPLSLNFPLTLTEPSVVAKSYPEFWEHWKSATSSKE
jgi:3-phosphoshikimate 1-carboxyvinyltransferase